jgi:hypothetical protein
MLKRKLARSNALRIGIVVALVLLLLVVVFVANSPFAQPSHQLAASPVTCPAGTYTTNPAGKILPVCPPAVKPLAHWGS